MRAAYVRLAPLAIGLVVQGDDHRQQVTTLGLEHAPEGWSPRSSMRWLCQSSTLSPHFI